MKLIRVRADIPAVDAGHYLKRLGDYDFDVVGSRFAAEQTPRETNCAYLDRTPHINRTLTRTVDFSGVASPALEALMIEVGEAQSREELNTAGQALDRLLRAGQFWAPNWCKGTHWLALWDKFGKPPIKPKYDRGIVDTWWYDEAKAKRIANGN